MLPLKAFSMLILLALPSMAASIFQVDPVHSEISFRVRHLGLAKVYGRFVDYKGAIQMDEQDPSKSKVEVSINAASIKTENDARDKDLRGPNFFDVDKFPTLTFQSVAVKPVMKDQFDVLGDFTMRGITKRITIRMTVSGTSTTAKESRVGFEGSLTLSRYDYGIAYLPGVIGEEVAITLGIEAVKVTPKP